MFFIFILKFLIREKYCLFIYLIYINNDVNLMLVVFYKIIYLYLCSLGNVDEIIGNILFILCFLLWLIEFY